MRGKRIGFVDYRLDNFHAEVYLKALRGPLADRGYQVTGATALLAEPSRDWAAERGVPYFDDVERLAAASDHLMVLAPSRPDLHLGLCRQTFPFSMPTFVDKTFAPDERTAREIFALADLHATPVQTSSALRTTAVQRHVRRLSSPLRSLIAFASGPSFEEYGIHPVELVVSCLGPEAESIMRLGSASHPHWILQFSDDRLAIIDFNLASESPFSAMVSASGGYEHVAIDESLLFIEACGSILDFFDAGRPLIDRRESLAVRRILDRAMDAEACGRFLPLSESESSRHELAAPHWGPRPFDPSGTPGELASFKS